MMNLSSVIYINLQQIVVVKLVAAMTLYTSAMLLRKESD